MTDSKGHSMELSEFKNRKIVETLRYLIVVLERLGFLTVLPLNGENKTYQISNSFGDFNISRILLMIQRRL